MTAIAITESEPILSAIAGQRIPRRAWAEVTQLHNLLSEAARILQSAKRQAELLQRRAYFDGRAAGLAHAQSEAVKHVLEAQKQARDLVAASESRIVELAVSIVARIAPRPDQAHLRAAGLLRKHLAKYQDVELLLQIGEYKQGSDADADEAIRNIPVIRKLLQQSSEQRSGFDESVAALVGMLQ